VSARDALLGRLAETAARDPRILAVTIGGSAVVGELDEFSDVDVLIVCTDGRHDSLLADARAFAAGLGPLLSSFTGEHVGEPHLLICLFGPPLLHVDLKFVTRADLDRRVEDGIILWEREPGLVAASATAPAQWPAHDDQWIEDRFWVWVHYLAAKIGRGELFDCISGFAYLREAVFGPALAVRAGRRPQGVRRLELYAGDALPLLERTLADRTRDSCLAALHASVELYRRLRDEADAPGLVRRNEAEAASLAYLAELEQRRERLD
jgi:predicted nucleotidyltransferase